MAFDFGALAAGFSTGAAESIESRNKQIRNGATRELDQLVQEAAAKEKGLKTQRDTLTEQANQLASFANAQGVGFTKTQILGLIQQPATAKTVIEELKNKKDLRDVDFANIFKVNKPGTEMDPEEYVRRTTSIAKDQEAGKATPAVRGAFGFASPGVAQAEKEFETVSGRTAAEVRGIARGRVDMGEDFKPTEGTIDLSQFGNPETIANIQARLRDARANKESLDSPKNKKLSDQLVANAVIENQFKDKEDERKPRTASQITTIVNNSLRVGLQGYELGDKVRYDPETGSPIYTGDVAGANKYAEDKRKVVENQFKELGYIKDGKISNDRDARDALLPFASFDKDGMVNWRKPKIGADTGDTASQISQKPIVVPPAAIVNGKIDPKKMIPGQTYIENGKVKTWNGMSFQ